ncbi:hypothetical protein Tco_1080308 [Tanacetum coccineum]|uniref:CCHC-type domain-containing protein n=1 Tax=Tanacetum coccineum TaxID=301880 RepID=A0ABQ5HW96_9ASTR
MQVNTTVETLRRMVFGSRFFREGTKDGSPGDEETEHMSALFTILEYLYSGTFCKDNGSVRADEIPCGSTDPDDDNLWREGMENSCRVVIQGLSPNADISGHADNDLPRSYATVSYSVSPSKKGKRNLLRKRLSEGDEEEKEKLIISHFGNVLSIPSGLTNHRCVGCGEPLYGHPCRRCTCERRGNDLRDGYFFLCHSRNGDSFTYDSTPNSFDNPPDFSYPPPQPQYVPYFCELCGNDAHYGYDCPPQHAFEDKQYQPEGILELFRKLHDDVQNIHEVLAEYINTSSWNHPTIYCDDDDDDDEDYTIVITPDLPITDSLIMEDEHLNTIPVTESDELIKSSIENLVPIPSEYSIDLSRYLMMTSQVMRSEFNPIHNEDLDSTLKNNRFDTESYLLESSLNHDTLMAPSPKIDSLFDEFVGELITIPPRIANREHEEYISLLEREEIDVFPNPDDSIPPGIESDDYDSEDEDNSISFPEFESFHVDYPDSGDSTIDMVEDITVDVPNILPTHPILHMDFDFIPSHNDLGSDLDVSSPSGDINKIYDPGICIEVKSTRFLATQIPAVIDTLLQFFIKNEDKAYITVFHCFQRR